MDGEAEFARFVDRRCCRMVTGMRIPLRLLNTGQRMVDNVYRQRDTFEQKGAQYHQYIERNGRTPAHPHDCICNDCGLGSPAVSTFNTDALKISKRFDQTVIRSSSLDKFFKKISLRNNLTHFTGPMSWHADRNDCRQGLGGIYVLHKTSRNGDCLYRFVVRLQ